MNARPRLSRSLPYWGLIVGSAASTAFGVWMTVDKIEVMSAGLLDGTATGVEVYGGQSWAVFAAAFVAAGLVGFVAALALAAARSLLTPATESPAAGTAPTTTWQEEDADVETASDAAPPAAAAPEHESPAITR